MAVAPGGRVILTMRGARVVFDPYPREYWPSILPANEPGHRGQGIGGEYPNYRGLIPTFNESGGAVAFNPGHLEAM